MDGQINIIMIVLLFNKKKTMNSKSEKEKIQQNYKRVMLKEKKP